MTDADAITRLRRFAAAGPAVAPDDLRWVQQGISTYLNYHALSLELALGVTSTWRITARNAILKELARYYPPRELARALISYQYNVFPREAHLDQPPQHLDIRRQLLWELLKLDPDPPQSISGIKRILALKS